MGVLYGCNGRVLDVAQPANQIANKCIDGTKTGERVMGVFLVFVGIYLGVLGFIVCMEG